jgi:purine-cytosine permease-like protein
MDVIIAAVVVAVVGFVALYYGYRAIRFVARHKTEVERAHDWK